MAFFTFNTTQKRHFCLITYAITIFCKAQQIFTSAYKCNTFGKVLFYYYFCSFNL